LSFFQPTEVAWSTKAKALLSWSFCRKRTLWINWKNFPMIERNINRCQTKLTFLRIEKTSWWNVLLAWTDTTIMNTAL
jgi:hypothetical protein